MLGANFIRCYHLSRSGRGTAQFRRDEILLLMGLLRGGINYWCKCVMSLIYYTVLTFIEENLNCKQSLQSYTYVIALLSGAIGRV